MFWGVSDRFVTARTSVKKCRTGPINAQACAMKSRRNFSQGMHPIHPIALKTHVLGCFGPFHYCTKFDAKRAKLV
jgi:hypothetical protein